MQPTRPVACDVDVVYSGGRSVRQPGGVPAARLIRMTLCRGEEEVIMSMPTGQGEKRIGLLVVHGIGEQQPGETVSKVVEGLRLAFSENQIEVRVERADNDQIKSPGASDDVRPKWLLRVATCSREIRLYEVYWADILGGQAAQGSFDIEAMTALQWLPGMSLRLGLYRQVTPPRHGVSASRPVLSIVSACLYFAYHGTRLALRSLKIVLHLVLATVFLSLALVIYVLRVLAKVPLLRIFASPAYERMQSLRWVHLLLEFDKRLHAGIKAYENAGYNDLLDLKLAQVVGDIFTYVHSLGGIFVEVPEARRVAAKHILERFYGQLDRAARECDDIHVLAHSLGTVVAYHALTGYGLDAAVPGTTHTREPLHKVRHLYTIGSPLNKFKYFWPVLVTGEAPGVLVASADHWWQDRLAKGQCRFRWHNFYNPLDPISGRLDDVSLWPKVENVRVWAGGLATSHVIYERNVHFLSTLTAGLFGQSVELRRGYLWRVRGFVHGMTESVGTLGVLLSLIAVGLVAGVLTSFVIAWAIGSIASLVWGDSAGVDVRTWAFVTIVATMLIGSFFLGKRRAANDMAIWWLVYRARGRGSVSEANVSG
jgi:hypothetical protein